MANNKNKNKKKNKGGLPTVRSVGQITKTLNKGSKPRKKNIRNMIGTANRRYLADQEGLRAEQTSAFGDITEGANNRGLLFSGIPLSEQAEYTASEFLPAMAALTAQKEDRVASLRDMILGINQDNIGRALDMHNQDRDRRFQANEALKNRNWQANQNNLNRSASGGSGGGGGFIPSLNSILGTGNGNNNNKNNNNNNVNIPKGMQQLYNQVFVKPGGGMWSDRDLVNDYNATLTGARYGNARDIRKIKLYHAAKPGLFGNQIPNLNNGVGSGSGGGGGGSF